MTAGSGDAATAGSGDAATDGSGSETTAAPTTKEIYFTYKCFAHIMDRFSLRH